MIAMHTVAFVPPSWVVTKWWTADRLTFGSFR
jgi:hypothetical protein